MNITDNKAFKKIGFWLKLPILALLAVGLFSSPAIAKSDNSKLMDKIKIEFEQAIKKGDSYQAKTIWASIDSHFSDKYDKLTAKSMAFGGGSIIWHKSLNKLHAEHPHKFEEMALFLTSINLNFMNSDSKTESGILSGKVSTYKGKRIANAKVVFAGHETRTNEKGEFSLNGLPEGTYDLLAFAPGYQLDGDPARTVTPNRQAKLSLRLHASGYKLHPISQTAAREKMNSAMTQIGKAFKANTSGTETIQGTVVDAQSGAPIVGAKFMIAPVKKDVSLSRVAVTDKMGHFTLTAVHAGISDIVITPEDIQYHLPFGQTVNLSGGGKTHRATWKLKRNKN